MIFVKSASNKNIISGSIIAKKDVTLPVEYESRLIGLKSLIFITAGQRPAEKAKKQCLPERQNLFRFCSAFQAVARL